MDTPSTSHSQPSSSGLELQPACTFLSSNYSPAMVIRSLGMWLWPDNIMEPPYYDKIYLTIFHGDSWLSQVVMWPGSCDNIRNTNIKYKNLPIQIFSMFYVLCKNISVLSWPLQTFPFLFWNCCVFCSSDKRNVTVDMKYACIVH